MKTNDDKNIEKLIEKMLKNQKLDEPSFDFTSKIMQQIEVSENRQSIVYKPLLSRSVVVLIFVLVASVVIGSILFPVSATTSKWMINIDYSSIFKINRSYTKTVTYCILIGTLMLLMQFMFLKNYFNQKH